MYIFAPICMDFLYEYTKYIGKFAFCKARIEWQDTDVDR